jgi:hypothetical protein
MKALLPLLFLVMLVTAGCKEDAPPPSSGGDSGSNFFVPDGDPAPQKAAKPQYKTQMNLGPGS